MSPTARQNKRRRRQIAAANAAGIVLEPPTSAGTNGRLNRDRAALQFLAHYYAWSARKPHTPAGNDPRSGRPWPRFGDLAMAINQASDAAAARVCFARARAYPNPLP